jgi:hypothetical protein
VTRTPHSATASIGARGQGVVRASRAQADPRG